MKNKAKYLIMAFLFLSLLLNGLLLHYINETEEPKPSIMKLGFGEYDTVIYCERDKNDNIARFDHDKNSVEVGTSKILKGNSSLYFIGNNGKVDLSEYDAQGFVIDSDGNILYSLGTPTVKKEKVFVTPNGEKYHNDIYCAGKRGFEITLETAKMFDREPCKKCVV